MKELLMICMVALILGTAYASDKTFSIEPGMAKQEVVKILGKPAERSFKGEGEAWQYQKVVGFGQCSYTTIWFRKALVVGMTARRGRSVAGCGLGSHEIDWSQMPNSTP